MRQEIDRRDFSVNKVTSEREITLKSLASEVSESLSGEHEIKIASFDATMGNPAMVISKSAPAETGNYIQRALAHVQNISQALGLPATQPAEVVDPNVQQTSSGAVAVHLRQQYKGIPIF
jgi:extracellular elastinolytic metalloproteinase